MQAQVEEKKIPGIVIASNTSGAGKTTITLALLSALRKRGLQVRAGKIGPDYLDTEWHNNISGYPVGNFDFWTLGKKGLQKLWQRTLHTSPDVVLLEGAMGLYDGGKQGIGSTAQVADLLNLPIILVINARGMGQSVAALAEGFLHYGQSENFTLQFLGLICNGIGSPQHAEIIREALLPLYRKSKIPLLALLPREGCPVLQARHLGLITSSVADCSSIADQLAVWLEKNLDVDSVLQKLHLPSAKQALRQEQHKRFFAPSVSKYTKKSKLTIGVALDAALHFCYADWPTLLAELGAQTIFFSPLTDKTPPSGCAGLYFPGGYPELYAEQLSGNQSMLLSLQTLAKSGLPMYGECGGLIYLAHSLRIAEQIFPMAGILPLTCILGKKIAALGYREVVTSNWLTCGQNKIRSRGHEFHYVYQKEKTLPTGWTALWLKKNSAGQNLGFDGCRRGNLAAGWVHLAPEAATTFWRAWLKLCAMQQVRS